MINIYTILNVCYELNPNPIFTLLFISWFAERLRDNSDIPIIPSINLKITFHHHQHYYIIQTHHILTGPGPSKTTPLSPCSHIFKLAFSLSLYIPLYNFSLHLQEKHARTHARGNYIFTHIISFTLTYLLIHTNY
jgi:hypothetical protein